MDSKNAHSEQTVRLPESAEKIAEEKAPLPPDEVRRMFHELRSHQIELEMQNEELRVAQEALERMRSRYFDLYNLSPVGYVTLSEKGLILEANLPAATLLGVERDKLIKQPITRFIFGEDRDIYYRHRKQLFETGGHQVCELQMMKKDGTPFQVQLETKAARDADGVLECHVVLSDITKRKLTEEGLRQSEECLEFVLKGSQLGYWDWNLETGEVKRNERWAEMLGYTLQDLDFTVEQWLDFVHPDDRSMADQAIKAHLEGRTPVHKVEYRMRTKEGQYRWIMDQAQVVKRNSLGQPIRMSGTHTDITERKQAEAERIRLEAKNRQRQKAESLRRMAAAIAHHFNNQLMVLMGNLELAMADLHRGNPPVKKLTAAMDATLRAAEMSGLMLTYLGQTSAQQEPMDVCEVCRRDLPFLQAALPKRVLLATTFPSPGPVISGNINQIQQLLVNLLTNAQEATAGDNPGAIALTVKTVLAAEIPTAHRFPVAWRPQDNRYACLEVADSGCGIAEKDIEKIFDPFFTSKFTGRGLGLSVIIGILRAHRGAICVESEPDRGSIFRVFLPVLAEAIPHPPEKTGKTPEMAGIGTVLLVEDEETVRQMAAAMLTRLGFTVVEAKDGGEAMDIFRRHRNEIRCVLCDLTMPRMNGWKTLSALRRLSPGIPVILTSGYNESRAMAGDHPEQPDAFLHKPFSMKKLTAVMRQVLTQGDIVVK